MAGNEVVHRPRLRAMLRRGGEGVTPMAELAFCPSCELKHVRRADWRCPRCRATVEAVDRPRRRAQAWNEGEFPRGSHVAGAVLGIWAFLLGLSAVRVPYGTWEAAGWITVAVDGLCALLLVAGWQPARPLVLGRVFLGAVAVLGFHYGPAGLIPTLAVLAFHVGLVVLILGRPGPAVTGVGVLLGLPLLAIMAFRPL